MKKIFLLLTLLVAIGYSSAFAAAPKVFFSDLTDGPTSGWEGSFTKGAAVSIWGINFGASRGSSTVAIGGITLNQDSDFAEWGATTNPTTARGLQRITFWLKSTMAVGATTITVTTSEGQSNIIPFYCRVLGTNHIYFISRTGNDSNNGLYATQGTGNNGPWKLASKVKGMVAGDVCYFRSGIWNEIDDWDNVIDFWANVPHGNGIANKSISIVSYPTEVAQLGDNTTPSVIGHHGSAGDILNYWTFSKFIMRSNGNTTSWGQGSSYPGTDNNNRFIGNDISTTYGGKTALDFCGQGGGQTHLYIYGNYIHDCGTNYRGQTPQSRGYPLYIEGYGTHDYIYVAWNEFSYNADGRGMQVYGHRGTDWVDHLYIHDNFIHHNGLTGAILGGGDNANAYNYQFIKNIYFYNNILAYNGAGEGGGFPSLLMGGEGWGSTGGNWYIYNNTLYNDDGGAVYISTSSSPTSIVMKNNIIYVPSGRPYYDGKTGAFFTGSNNCYYGNGNGPSWDTNRLDNTNPQFVVDTPTTDLEFQLRNTSLCRDGGTSGVNVIVTEDYLGIGRPQGTGYDIGAYEYDSGTPANNPPVLNSIGNKSVNENALLQFTISATDADGNTLTYSASGLPSGVTFSGQAFSWIPTYTQAGNYNVTFSVSDGNGGTDSETITITVNNVNRAPVLASIGNKTVAENSTLTFGLSATDPDADTLTYSASNLPTGATFNASTRVFSWTPTDTQAGSYTVTFSVTDSNNASDSENITITVEEKGIDIEAPYVDGLNPENEEVQVPIDTNITLHIKDKGRGVDINTISLSVQREGDAAVTNIIINGINQLSAYPNNVTIQGIANDYIICYDPPNTSAYKFRYEQVISVRVNASDLDGNSMGNQSHSFTTAMMVRGKNLKASKR